jgi:hypothetical protein
VLDLRAEKHTNFFAITRKDKKFLFFQSTRSDPETPPHLLPYGYQPLSAWGKQPLPAFMACCLDIETIQSVILDSDIGGILNFEVRILMSKISPTISGVRLFRIKIHLK